MPARRPPFVGLTGGIGAGKSTVRALFAERGAATLSSDDVVRTLYDDPAVVAQVAARLGSAVAPGGTVDRQAVARVVFADPAERRWLEGLLHPLVAQRTAAWRAAEEARPAGERAALLVHEVPLLMETNLDRLEGWYDAVVVVTAPAAVRATRAEARGGQVDIAGRQAAQLDDAERASRATHVIDNTGDRAALAARVADLYAELSA